MQKYLLVSLFGVKAPLGLVRMVKSLVRDKRFGSAKSCKNFLTLGPFWSSNGPTWFFSDWLGFGLDILSKLLLEVVYLF